MSASDLINILIGIAVVALLIVRQMSTRPVRETSAARIILILGVIGIVEMVNASKHHTVRPGAVALIVLGLVLAGGFGAWRATTVRVWRDANGAAWRKGTAATAVLWIIAIATHIVIDVVISHT